MHSTLFTSSREKRLWLWTGVVIIVIYSTLFIGQPLLELLSSQDLRAAFFLLGMFLVGVAILLHGWRAKPDKFQIALITGLLAVYVMFFLRLGMPERSHLIEYSVLAIFVHQALIERLDDEKGVWITEQMATVLAFLVGVLDESVQLFIPDRVFDPVDILFNGMVITMAIGSALLLQWIRKRTSKSA